MRSSLLLLALLAGCAPSEDVGVQRQALPARVPEVPLIVGQRDDARLGTSVAGCRFQGFAAGSPGDNFAVLVFGTDGGASPFWLALPFNPGMPNAQGLVTTCEGGKTTWNVASGSTGGLFVHQFIASVLGISGVRGLARSSRESSGYLAWGVAGQSGVDRRVIGDAGVYVTEMWSLRADGGSLGAALAWSPDDSLIAVTDDAADTVQLFDSRSRTVISGGTFQGPRDAGFGLHLAFGDVHPNPGAELLATVEATREVLVIGKRNGGLTVLQRLSPPAITLNMTSPMPLAIEPRSVLRDGVLQAVWVGLPEEDALWRFVGDAGVKFEALGPMEFGAALAVTGETLIIGAPGYEPNPNGTGAGHGAVFGMDFNTDVLGQAEAQECDVTRECITSECFVGRCVGGVICQQTAMAALCPAAECRFGVCLSPPDAGTDAGVDAGTPDAGTPDAGTPDAGERDAGTFDAGRPDAGSPGEVQKFSACGCSADGLASTSVLALIIVALARRRSGSPTG